MFFQPPATDAAKVARLTELAAELDGAPAVDGDDPLVVEFNRLAGTSLSFEDFQGIYGAEEHETFVRRLLARQAAEPRPALDRDGLVALFARIVSDPCDDAFLEHAFATIEATYGDGRVSDLVFWPGRYLADHDGHELTPEEMADAVLARSADR